MSNPDSILKFYLQQDEGLKSNITFTDKIKEKLGSISLTQSQIDKYSRDFNSTLYTNLIIVPDLSNRIDGAKQMTQDIEIISAIYDQYINLVLNSDNYNKKDRLTFDFTNPEQTNGIFKNLASKITFDLGENKNSFNKKDIASKKIEIRKNIEQIYTEARKNIIGNDYYLYLKEYLTEIKIKKNTLDERWSNKIIFITDGYLEPTKDDNYTPINSNPKTNPIHQTGRDFSNVDIFICQVQTRDYDKGKEDILKQYWEDWFVSMKFNNLVNNGRWWSLSDPNINATKMEVKEFLEYDSKNLMLANNNEKKNELKEEQVISPINVVQNNPIKAVTITKETSKKENTSNSKTTIPKPQEFSVGPTNTEKNN